MKDVARKGQDNLFKGSEQEAADELERLIKESIKGQMISDVPLGAFLSAGIDSSTIVSLMQQVAPGRVKTFTIGMHEQGFNEADIAKEIAGILGTEHTEMYIDDSDAKAVIPKIADMFGEPFADSSQIPTYLVSKMTRQHVTVSLSGDAGDELFSHTTPDPFDQYVTPGRKVDFESVGFEYYPLESRNLRVHFCGSHTTSCNCRST